MRESYLNFFSAFVFTMVFFIGVCNFINQMHHADTKEFWLDENFGLQNTVKNNTYIGLLGKGAVLSEANAAPLDYIFTKILQDLKDHFRSFGLSDKVYYRLWANFVMVFSGLVVVFLLMRNIMNSSSSLGIRLFQIFLLAFLPFLYLYRPMTYHYAAEVRPYALWFALWLVTIAFCSLTKIPRFLLSLCLSLLAMTIVGSFFQIVAVAIAYGGIRWMQSGWKEALKDSSQVFIVPFFLVVYYAYPAAYGHRTDETWAVSWHRFYDLWGHEAIIIPMSLVVLVSLSLMEKTRAMMVGPLAATIVFLMGPLIFFSTVGRGYFFTERQYIYYDAHRAVFWLGMINALPFYLGRIKDHRKQALAMAVIFVLWIPFIFPKKTMIYIHTVIDNTRLALKTHDAI